MYTPEMALRYWLLTLSLIVFSRLDASATRSECSSHVPVEAAVAIDVSDGTTAEQFQFQLATVIELIRDLPPESVVRIIESGAMPGELLDSRTYRSRETFLGDVSALTFKNNGQRNTAALIRYVQKHFKRPDEKRTQMFLAFVNGPSNSPSETFEAIKHVKFKVIVMTSSAIFPELAILATDRNHTFHLTPGLNDTGQVKRLICYDSVFRCDIDRHYNRYQGCRKCQELCGTKNDQCLQKCPYFDVKKKFPDEPQVAAKDREKTVTMVIAFGASFIVLLIVLVPFLVYWHRRKKRLAKRREIAAAQETVGLMERGDLRRDPDILTEDEQETAIETANAGETAEEDTETIDEAAEDDEETIDETAGDGAEAMIDEAVEDGAETIDGTAEDGAGIIDGTAEDGEEIIDGMADDEETIDGTAIHETARDGDETTDQTVDDAGETTDEGTPYHEDHDDLVPDDADVDSLLRQPFIPGGTLPFIDIHENAQKTAVGQ